MQAIEATGTINAQGQLFLDQPLQVNHPTRVRVIGLLTEASNQTSEQIQLDLASHQTVPETDQASDTRPIWERVADISAQVPLEEWAKVPKDLSKNVDHYLYGSPKEDE
jgi:hypothetical protein